MAAIVSCIGLSMGLYELVTGRLMPVLTLLRRRVPATAADLRENAIALILNEVAVFLMVLPVLGNLLLYQARFNAVQAGAFFALGLTGFLAAGASGWASSLVKRNVRMVRRTGRPRDLMTERT